MCALRVDGYFTGGVGLSYLGYIWSISGLYLLVLLVLLARYADHDAFVLWRSHCPHDDGRDRGRLSAFYAFSYRDYFTATYWP